MLTSSYYNLNVLALFKLSGPDAETFLQNYTSNNVKKLQVGAVQPSCFLNHKGHIIAIIDLYKINDGYLIALSKHKEKLLQEHLQKYLMLSDSVLTTIDITEYIHLLNIEKSPNTEKFLLDGVDTNEKSLVHDFGLEKTHVDFHKGCYLGQEIVARVESRGNKQRLRL